MMLFTICPCCGQATQARILKQEGTFIKIHQVIVFSLYLLKVLLLGTLGMHQYHEFTLHFGLSCVCLFFLMCFFRSIRSGLALCNMPVNSMSFQHPFFLYSIVLSSMCVPEALAKPDNVASKHAWMQPAAEWSDPLQWLYATADLPHAAAVWFTVHLSKHLLSPSEVCGSDIYRLQIYNYKMYCVLFWLPFKPIECLIN